MYCYRKDKAWSAGRNSMFLSQEIIGFGVYLKFQRIQIFLQQEIELQINK